jgi:threonine dehydrogenase-like Zn-dependent dehydrogenase
MTERLLDAIVVILVGIVGVAAVAVIVSKQSDTVKVIGAGSSGFARILCAALQPLNLGGGVCARPLVESVDSNVIFT